MSVRAPGNRAVMLVYHSINTIHDDRIRVLNLVSPANFAEQMAYLAARTHVISLPDYLDCVHSGAALPKNSVIITFDDGYKDNLTVAYPILSQYGFPATLFLATDYIGSGKMKWEDRLSCLLRRSDRAVIDLDISSNRLTFPVHTQHKKFQAINQLVRLLSKMDQPARQHVMTQVEQQLGLTDADIETGDLMLTWDDVRQMARTPGMTFGAHTVTHRHLTRIPVQEAEAEIMNSKRHIEVQLQRPVTLFSYPYGDFDLRIAATVKASGFACAVTLVYGQNSPETDPFQIKRVQIPDQRGNRFWWGLRLRTSALGEPLKRGYNLAGRLSRLSPARS